MQELLGKKIVAIDEKREKSPFYRILLDDGTLLHFVANFDGQDSILAVYHVTDPEDAFELSGNMILDSHNRYSVTGFVPWLFIYDTSLPTRRLVLQPLTAEVAAIRLYMKSVETEYSPTGHRVPRGTMGGIGR